jgi:hypothetical protein
MYVVLYKRTRQAHWEAYPRLFADKARAETHVGDMGWYRYTFAWVEAPAK